MRVFGDDDSGEPRRLAAFSAVLLAIALVGPPTAAQAAVANVNTTAQGLRVNVTLAGIPLNPSTTQSTWQTGQAANTKNVANVNAVGLLTTGAVTASTGPDGEGGKAAANVDGLNLLGASTLSLDAVSTACAMTPVSVTGGTDTTNLKLLGTTTNPSTGLAINLPNILTGTLDKQTATYNSTSGRLNFTVRGLDLKLLGGVAEGTVVVAESTCSGVVKFGAVQTTSKTIVPGTTATPTVTVMNAGEVAAPNTVITIPAPPTGYTLGEVTTTGGGTCSTSSTTQIRCTGVTVPGGGSATVSLPVTVAANAAGAGNWSPDTGTITAVSTPFPNVPDTTMSVSGSGRLVTVGTPQTTGGSITVTQMTVPAGKSAQTPITVTNAGPSDARTTVTIPLAGRPDGVSIVSAAVGSNPCAVTASTITCADVTVPANDKIEITVKAAATNTTAPGVTWDVANIRATLNGFALTGQGRLLTVSDPDVNLNNGVSITPATAIPGGTAATARIKVANTGIIAGTNTTLTIPAPPAGYQVGTLTTTGGGTCTSTAASIYCSGVTVPPMGSVTVSVPVTLASNVTAHWVTTPTSPVSATSGDSTGQTSGVLITAAPQWTFSVNATGPAPRTVLPGQRTTMNVTVTNDGPSDSTGDTFTVLALHSTTFGTLDGTAAQYCTRTGPTALSCDVSLKADDDVALTLPLTISAQADPTTPLDGGCVSFNGDADCDDPEDEGLPSIQLRTPLSTRLTTTLVPVTVTPGLTGVARVRLTSKQDEDGLSVTVPVGALPDGFRVTNVSTTASPGVCTIGANAVTCTGLELSSGQQREVTLAVALDSNVTPPAKWTATGVSVSDGDEQVTRSGDLAVAGPPVTDLAATVTGPADNTVLPGANTQLTVVVSNAGPSDAADATVTVVAPNGSSFGTPTAPTSTYCILTSSTRAQCKADIAANDETPPLVLPLVVSPAADPFTPLGGGCVDLDGVTGCGQDDELIDPIVLAVPFDRQVTVETAAAAVTPGRQDVATISVTASHGDQNGISVTVPLAQLPAGLSVATRSATNGGACTATATQVTCTGLTIMQGQTGVVSLGIAATSAAVENTTWTPTAITVARSTESKTTRGRLAVVGAPQYTLDTTVTGPADPIEPGGTGTLGVEIDNTGPSDATDETVSVLAPDGATFGTLTSPTADVCTVVSPTRVTCTFDLPEPAAPLRLNLPIVVSPGADPGTPLSGGCVDLNNNGVCDTTDEPLPGIVLGAPFDRQLDIATTAARVTPGTTGSAQVLLSASPAQTGLTLSIPLDTKPAQMTVGTVTASPTGTCTVGTNAITCTGVSVPPGGATITVSLTVPGDAPANLVWATRAIKATNADGDEATGAGLLVRTGEPQYTLNAAITGPQPGTVLPGDTTGMQVTLTNTGASTATNALVTLRAPVGTAFGSLTGSIADSCTPDSATRLSCSVTLAVAPASLVWTVPIVVPGNANPDQALTGGCLDLDGDSACGGTNDRALPDIVLATPLGQVTTISATNTPIVPGRTATTTVTVAVGQARGGVRVTIPRDALPAGVTTTGIATGAGTCTATSTSYTCGDFSIGAGSSVALQVSLAATPAADPGSVWAPAVVVSRGSEAVSRTVTAATVSAADAQLTVTVVGPADGTLLPGDTADLAVTVANAGPSDARNARFTFRAPTGTSFAQLSPAVAEFCVPSSATQVDCTLDVAAATNVPFTLQVLVPPTANPATPVEGGCIDTNRDGACTTPPDNPLPGIELGAPLGTSVTVATRTGTATPGLSSTGYVVLTSQRAATDLTVSVPLAGLPTGFTVTSATGPTGSSCQVQTVQVVCTGVTVASGTTQAVALVVATASNLAAGVSWNASPITVTRGTQATQGTGTILTTGTPAPGVSVTVTGPADPVETGTTTTMTVTVTNVGPSDATGQTATIQAPSQTTFGTLSGQAAADCTVVSTTQLSCRFDLAVGADARVWVLPVAVAADADADLPATGGCVTVGSTRTCLADIDVNDPLALYQPLKNTAEITFAPEEISSGSSGTPSITVADSSIRDGLSLIVPLPTVNGFTVTGATPQSSDGDNASGACELQDTQVSCTGMAVEAGTITVTLAVDVASGTADTAKWTATNVTLTDDDSPTDQLVASGVLVTTGGEADTVTTTFGAPTVNPAAPGQKTVLPIKLSNPGPNDASPHVMTLKVPNGLTPRSPLPDDCAWDEDSNVVTCTRDLVVGDEYTYNIPFVVGRTVSVNTSITGGCLDAEPANGSCDDADDQPMPAISVVASRVDLELGVKRKTTTARPGATVLLKLPYSNNGSQTANGIVFEIDPPDGVNLEKAQVLLDASASAALVQAAASDELSDVDCIPDETGDENAVVCDGPNAPVGASSELWLTVRITSAAKKGVHPVRVTISTTSPEGNVSNNTIEALLSIAGSADTGTDTPSDNSTSGGSVIDNLPKTGQSLVGLLAISVMLIIGGAMARIGARKKPLTRHEGSNLP